MGAAFDRFGEPLIDHARPPPAPPPGLSGRGPRLPAVRRRGVRRAPRRRQHASERRAPRRTTSSGGCARATRRRSSASATPWPIPAARGELWYVYRFGSVRPGRRWWEEPGHAWAILDGDRCFVEVSTSLAEIVEVPARRRSSASGSRRSRTPVTRPSAPTSTACGSELLARASCTPRSASPALDGTPREIEYHVTTRRGGPGPAPGGRAGDRADGPDPGRISGAGRPRRRAWRR